MPTYDYRCEANGQVVEVQHRMSEHVATWGDLCERAGIDRGDTPADAAVTKLLTGGNVMTKATLGSGSAPACPTGGCCSGGMCGLG